MPRLNKYYEWTTLYNNPDVDDVAPFIIIGELKMNGLVSWDLMRGQNVDHWSSGNYGFFSKNGAELDVLPQISGIKVISEKCMMILKLVCGNEIQFLPIDLIYEKNEDKRIEGYYIINNLLVVDCIDYNNTEHEYDEEDDEISLATPDSQLCIQDSIASKHGIFRLKRYEIATILRADVADELRNAGITGLGLREIYAT